MHDDVRGGLVRARCHTHRSADERAHLRANDQRGADGIARHLRAVCRSDRIAHTGSDGRTHTGSDGVANTGAISVADRRADEGADHRPDRRDAVKCTYTRSEPARCT